MSRIKIQGTNIDMTTKDRREREREQRRQHILRVARSLIIEQGYDQTTMQEVADRAELSKGTLYLYFDSKDVLFMTITVFVLSKIRDKFRDVMKQDQSGFVLVEKLGGVLIDFMQSHPAYMKILTLFDAKVDSTILNDYSCCQEYEETVQELLMTWTRAVQVGMQDGSIAVDTKPKVLAIQLGYGIRGILQLYHHTVNSKVANNVVREADETLESIISQFIRVLLNGIEQKNNN